LRQHGIKISKLHLSSALKIRPTPEARRALAAFSDETYLHQVVARAVDGTLTRWKDLEVALAQPATSEPHLAEEWRIHFHIPLHASPTALFDHTTDHLLGALEYLRRHPGLCAHLEMETYTWEVMPPEMKNRSVVDQLAAEYDWTLPRLAERGFAPL
jgi:hypothetical protein